MTTTAAFEADKEATALPLKQVSEFEAPVHPGPVIGKDDPSPRDIPVSTRRKDCAAFEVKLTDLPEAGMEAAAQEALTKAALQTKLLAEQEAKAIATLQGRLQAAQEALKAAEEARAEAALDARDKADLVAKAIETSTRAEQEARAKAEEAARAKAELETIVRAAQSKAKAVQVLVVQPANGGAPTTVEP